MIQEFVIPGKLPSLNEYIQACRRSPHAGGAFKREAQNQVCWAIRQSRLKKMGACDFTFHWIEPNMKRDKDNIRSAAKYILDALVEMQIIPNDTWKYVGDLTDKFSVNKAQPRIIVTMEEINEALQS